MLRKQREKEAMGKYRKRRLFGLLWFLVGFAGLLASDIDFAWLDNTPYALDKQNSSRLEIIGMLFGRGHIIEYHTITRCPGTENFDRTGRHIEQVGLERKSLDIQI